MRYWFLQTNPKSYRIDNYLQNKKIIIWHFKYKASSDKKLAKEDKVYIWRARGSEKEEYPGIIAHGTVIAAGAESELEKKHPSFPKLAEEGKKYWRGKNKNDKNHDPQCAVIKLDIEFDQVPYKAIVSKVFLLQKFSTEKNRVPFLEKYSQQGKINIEIDSAIYNRLYGFWQKAIYQR